MLLLLAAAVLVVVSGLWHEAVLDDAFIAFRYARNLVAGHGLVFNPGERVEGFTSPAWTLLVATGMALGADPVRFAQVSAILCNLTLAWTVHRFARQHLELGDRWAWVPVWILVGNLNLAAWAAHGLETSLFALLVMVGTSRVVSLESEGPRGLEWTAGLAFAAATWTRPEGLVFWPVLVMAREGLPGTRGAGAEEQATWFSRVARAVQGWVARVAIREWRGVVAWTVPVVVLFLARRIYYDAWLPNTYYAKATGGAGTLGDGLTYFLDFVSTSWLHGVALIPVVVALWHGGPARRVLAAAVGLNVAYVVWLGGDTFAGARFFVPTLAPFALLVGDGVVHGLRRLDVRPPFLVAAAGALTGAMVAGTWPELSRQAELAASMTRNRAFVGKLLKEITPPDTVIALNTVGALPYYAERPAIDLYGLTDAHIARVPVDVRHRKGGIGHEKGDGDYVMSRAPHLILLRNVWIADVPIEDHHVLYGRSEHEIAGDPRFLQGYTPVDLPLRPDLYFGFYANRKKVDIPALRARFEQVNLETLGPLDRLSSERGMDLVLYHQGLAYLEEGRLPEARRSLAHSLALYPKSVDAHVALARVLDQEGDLQAAARHLTEAVALSPGRADLLSALATLSVRQGKIDEAVHFLRRAARLAPEDPDTWRDLATLLLNQHRFQEAVPVLHTVVTLLPGAHDMWVKLGVAAGKTGDWTTAACARDRAVRLAPEAREVRAFEAWFAREAPVEARERGCPHPAE